MDTDQTLAAVLFTSVAICGIGTIVYVLFSTRMRPRRITEEDITLV
jgi:hypothetical protein